MIVYQCDHCGNSQPNPTPYVVQGEFRTKGGVLLPGPKTYHFCSIRCFIAFTETVANVKVSK
jgi:hypothetical protein